MPTYRVRVFDEDTLTERDGCALNTTNQNLAWGYYQRLRDRLDGCVVTYEIDEQSETA